MYTTNTRYYRPHHHNSSTTYHQTQQQPQYTSSSPTKYTHPQYSSPTKYNTGYDGYASPVKPTTSYRQRSYAEYYSSPSSPTYYNQQQQEYYNSGASTASSSSQEGPFYADELDELDDYNMGMASADMTTIPTVPTPVKLSLYELGKTPSGRVMVTAGNQTIEFFSCTGVCPRDCYVYYLLNFLSFKRKYSTAMKCTIMNECVESCTSDEKGRRWCRSSKTF